MKKVLKILLIVLLAIILGICGLCAFLTITEYKPAQQESLVFDGNTTKSLSTGDEVTLLTYNIGYGSLSADMDHFSDGGKMVSTQTEDVVKKNLDCMFQIMRNQDCDLYLLQEVDEKASRSHGIDMVSLAKTNLIGVSAFGYDYKCKIVPFPFKSPTGNVNSGIMSTSKYEVSEATRHSFYSDAKWPLKIVRKKNAFLVERINLADSPEKQLVLVNVNFYDGTSSSVRIEQTKQLAAFLNEEYAKGNFVIAGGTFNQTFPGADASLYPIRNTSGFLPGIIERSLFGEGWSFAFDERTPTTRLMNAPYNEFDPYTQYFVIDGFILSPNITLKGTYTIDTEFKYSKHQPVKARIILGQPPAEDEDESAQ